MEDQRAVRYRIQHGFGLLLLLTTLIVFTSSATAGTGQLLITPSTVNFGAVAVGTSQTQTVTLTNSGGPKIIIIQGSLSGTDFALSGLSLPVTLAGGQSLTCTVTFAPVFAGADSGSVSILVTSQSSGSKKSNSTWNSTTVTLVLSGTGVSSGQLVATPTPVGFGNVQVGNSQVLTESLSNTGGADLTVSVLNVTGAGFSVSGITVPFTLAIGQTANFSVAFSPASAGTATGNIAVSSNAANSTLNIAMSGTAVAPAQLAASPGSLSFGPVATGSSSTLASTLTNVGGSALTISQISSSGSGFSYSGIASPVTLGANQTVTFNVTFAPLTGGSATGNIVANSDASDPTLFIPLSGSGTAPGQLAVSPATISFGSVVVGTTQAQSATLTANNGPVTVTAAAVSQPQFTVSGGLSLPITIPAGYSAPFSVVFAPQTSGTVSGSISFASNASSTPTVQSLTGTGATPPQHSVALAWIASSSSNVVGYNVYRGTATGGPYAEITSAVAGTTQTDGTVQAGQTYYYVVTAVDTSGKESSYSNQVKAMIPTP